MNVLLPIRAELRALLGENCSLRRDRTAQVLFISDKPRRAESAETSDTLREAGYRCFKQRELLHIDLEPARYFHMISSLPCAQLPLSNNNLAAASLCKRLLYARTPPEKQSVELLRFALLRLDAGEKDRLIEELPPLLSVLQREKKPLPSAIGTLLALSEPARDEDNH